MDNYNISREDEQVKKTFSGEKKKLSSMNKSQKAEYIWDYYKFHIIIAIAIIVALIGFVRYRMTYEVDKLYGVLINSVDYNENIEKEIKQYVGMEKHEGVSFVTGLEGNVDNPSSYDNPLSIYTGAAAVDFVFTDKMGADYVCVIGCLSDVTKELPKQLLDIWSDRVVEMSFYDLADETKEITCAGAIDISGTAVQKYFGLSDKTCYLMIENLSGNQVYMEKFYQMLYDIETGKIK